MLRRLALCWIALVLSACATAPTPAENPPVILVSLDGFRPDYLDRGVTPVLSWPPMGCAAPCGPRSPPRASPTTTPW